MTSFLLTLAGIVALLSVWSPLALPLFILGMTRALGSVSVRRTAHGVRLTSLDGALHAGALMVVSLVPFALLGLKVSACANAALTLVALSLAHGCRVRVDVTREGAVCTRRILWLVVWRRFASRSTTAWVDGWGDFADPAALNIGSDGTDSPYWSVELGWGGSTSGDRADRLAAEFNAAVKALHAELRHGAPPSRAPFR